MVAAALEADLISATSPKARKEVAVGIRQAVAAWEVCCDRVRIARNRPLPGSLRPEVKYKKARAQSAASWSESPNAETAHEPITNIELDKQSQNPPDNPRGL